jgi:hypothetical protein
MEEGLDLALSWSSEAFVMESDCAEAISLVSEGCPNLSRYAIEFSLLEKGLGRER